KIGPDPRNFNQRVSLGRNDLLIRTFLSTYTSPATIPGNYPRPLRNGEETTSLWIAPYVDADDVYHQPATVLFVVKPSAWGQPRLN
ncbi:type IV conjugative transfer system lipoprotein TraV, partial [Klebsiella pneumoniae]|uniref:type IV conjugative transfer system lipoprotein TraV n=1 Tax=Klebsiella pneumoniae TaxID=573 RepID=UPI001FB3BEA3